MKKISKIIIISALLVCLCGCGKKDKNEVLKCTFKTSQQNYNIETTNNISSKDNIVTSVQTKTIIKSDSKDILEEFKNSYESQYKELNKKYKGYDYTVKIKDDKLSILVNIDYNKFNLKKFANDNVAMKKYLNKQKKFKLDGAKEYYESIGSKCK